MKRAVLLHGTDGKPNDLWFPWLSQLLEVAGYEIYAPLLPENHTPNREVYEKFLQTSDWDFTDNVIVGHSSGATTLLNLLASDWFPKIKAAVLVGTFLNERLSKNASWYEPGQFDHLFPASFDVTKIAAKAERFYFVHGDNDPYCDIEDARKLCEQFNGEFIVVKNGHHLAKSSGITELPLLEKALRQDNLIPG